MTENPFETPRVPEAMDASFGAESQVGTFDLDLAFKTAWKAYWAAFPTTLAFVFVGLLVTLLAYVTIIGAFLVVPVLLWGFVAFMLKTIDGEPTLSDMFAGFSEYGRALLSMLGLFSIQFMLSLAGQFLSVLGAVVDSTLLSGVGSVVSVLWMFLVIARVSFAPFYIVDKKMGVMDALRKSFEVTRQQKGKTALLFLGAGLITAAGLFVFLIGVLVSAVVGYLFWAAAYRQLEPRGGGDYVQDPYAV